MGSQLGNILLGTSGWSYKEWVGPFYKESDKSKLRAYTRIFKTVEIDSTFYRYPSKGTVMGWARYSPEGFIFTAKLPGLITHDKKLSLEAGIEKDVERFVELMEPLVLGGKLGCILIQLPPRFSYRPKELEGFLETLPTHVRWAVEFRDLSWMRNETWNLLEKYQVAYTNVDEPLLPPETHVTADVAYFRWHGRGKKPWYDYRYSMQELQPWMPKVENISQKVKKTYGYFNNHYHGYAVENCLQVMEMLGSIDTKQAEAKARVESHFKISGGSLDSTLESFIGPKDMSRDSLIRYFVTTERLHKAENIEDSELNVQHQDPDRIEATIREYAIVIDRKLASISHNCPDWEKVAATKKLCKHVAKLLLWLKRDQATTILQDMFNKQQTWQYVHYAEE